MIIRAMGLHHYAWALPRMTPGRQDDHRTPHRGHAWSESIGRDIRVSGLALVCVGITTIVLLVLRGTPLSGLLLPGLLPLGYLIPVILSATRWGRWPSIVASLASVCSADFFFFEPLYSFRITDPQEAIDLFLFLIVALVSSNLASRLRSETRKLRERQTELQHLYTLSRSLASCFTVSDLISAVQTYLSTYLQQTAVFLPIEDGMLHDAHGTVLPEGLRDLLEHHRETRQSLAPSYFDDATRDVWLIWNFRTKQTMHGVIVVNLGHGGSRANDNRASAEIALRDATAVLGRLDIGRAMVSATLHQQTQSLRDAFLGALSHELRSPIAAIYGSASVLSARADVRENENLHHLVRAISDEISTLDGFIQNILHATRITVGGIAPHVDIADPSDVINAALRLRERRLAAHRVSSTHAKELPFIKVDTALVAEALGQILENAAKYSPTGSTIAVSVTAEDGKVIFTITDQGVGITIDERKQLGRRAFRSPRHQASISGSGLGFWIASTFIGANNGTIRATSTGLNEGTAISVSFPAIQVAEHHAAGSDD